MDPEPSRLRKTPEIAFACPACGSEAVAGVDGVGSCRSCAASPRLEIPDALKATRIVESCRVKNTKTKVADLRQAFTAVPGNARLVIDKGNLAPNQTVE